ncbi:MAG: 30S ribosomal protein S4, partial [Candidatus Pacebacteria bacterium]|nr:30S ribosomal protein S4 [Candidatus Paceibacterota bacterium]
LKFKISNYISMLDSKCKQCRAIGEKLFLKGERCFTPKCALVRRGFPASGQQKRGRALTAYGKQLNEKQKVKLTYGIREQQFRRYVELSLAKKGTSSPNALAQLLESRFDSIVFRSGFAPSRTIARQLINHGHFLLNGRRHDIASTILKQGDIISIRPQSLNKHPFEEIKETLKKYNPPKYLQVDEKKLEGKVVAEPNLQELQLPFDFTSIIEFYSR